jgi:hypothetical protein
MSTDFTKDQLLDALDEIALAAIAAETHLDIVVFGGSALMLASNFRFSTEDVDIAEIGGPWPSWLSDTVARIGQRNGWLDNWFNEAVNTFLSSQAQRQRDLVVFGTFPRAADKMGLRVFVPTARYMLALKLKALRVAKFDKGSKDIQDIRGLLGVLGIEDAEDALAVLKEYYPNSAADVEKARFVLKHILANESSIDAPRYPR